jgi:myo-inositol-1(or 4)-monophosphatase
MAAVMHDVARGGVCTATAGGGAFVDGDPHARLHHRRPRPRAHRHRLPVRDVSYADRYLGMMKRIMPATAGMRRAGSAALDLSDVARGRFEAFWELWLNPWDLAAGVLLVREAGGRVTDLEGNDARLVGGEIVASNGVLHDWFLDILNDRT